MTSDPVSVAPEDKAAGASGDGPERLRALRVGPGRDRRALRWLLPLVALAIGAAIYALLVATREKPRTRDPIVPSPLVRVMTMTPQDLRLTVVARGTVAPRTESDMVAEVRGRVISMSPQLVVGGFFAKDDELLRLDDREHRIAVQRARANVTLRGSERRLAAADAERRRQLAQKGAASSADLEQFESRALVAGASLSEAEAALDQAELDLERTVVRAPFDGRVRERSVDIGRFVSPGEKLGRLFAVDYAEIRLPIQTDDLAFLETALDSAGQGETLDRAEVVLTGRLGGRELTWPARLVRAEAAIDEQTRMLHVVARVDDPYALAPALPRASAAAGASAAEAMLPAPPRAPLPSGLFVKAEIQGRLAENVFVLPPMALRDGDRVFVYERSEGAGEGTGAREDESGGPGAADAGVAAEPSGRLRVRDVSVIRRDRDRVVVGAGIEAGDRVVISPLRIYSEGMRLRMVEVDPAQAGVR